MQSPFLPERLAALWRTGKITESDWPRQAQNALEAGFDGRSLRRLAGLLQIERWEISRLIVPALQELGVQPMTEREAFRWLADEICRGIVSGSQDPFRGASALSLDMTRLSLSYPESLWRIFYEIEMEGTGALSDGPVESRQRIRRYAAEYL